MPAEDQVSEGAFAQALKDIQLLHALEVKKLRDNNRRLKQELEEVKCGFTPPANTELVLGFPRPLAEPKAAITGAPNQGAKAVQIAEDIDVVENGKPNDGSDGLRQQARTERLAATPAATAVVGNGVSPKLPAEQRRGSHGSCETKASCASAAELSSPPAIPLQASNSRLQRVGTAAVQDLRRASIVIHEFFTPAADHASIEVREMSCMEKFFKSDGFDLVVGIVILANAACIAIETATKGDTPLWLNVAEYVFLALYACELSIAFWYVGFRFALRSNWVKFDVLLVSCGVIGGVWRILEGDELMMDAVLVVRMLRLARIARVLRIMRMFKTLWRLVHGLVHAITTLVWTFALLFLLLFTFAVFGMEIIVESSSRSDTYNSIVRTSFGDLWDTSLTLVQVVTLDSAGPIYRPLVAENPALSIYFFAFILLVSIALMNLVTAIMVESALDKSAADKEVMRMWELQKKKKKVDRVQEIFTEMDADNSGKLTLDELQTAPPELKREFAELVETEDFEMLFQLLDYDQRGAVNIREFCDGIDKICRGKLEMFSLMFQGNSIKKKQNEMIGLLHEIKDMQLLAASDEALLGGCTVLSSV